MRRISRVLFTIAFLAIAVVAFGQEDEALPYAKFIKKARKANAVVLDVRTPREYEAGHLENAVLIDFNAPGFLNQINTLDKEKTYLLYCRSGNRSGKALKIMKNEGFERVYHLEGGVVKLPPTGILKK